MLKARESVRSLPAYQSPLVARPGLRLDLNENTAGCSPQVLARLRELTVNDVGYYREREPIEALMASHLGLDSTEVLLTNGADEGIHLFAETFLDPGDEALLVVPTFVTFETSIAATGARIVNVPCEANFGFPLERLTAGINPRTRLIAIANPNNPTGTVVSGETLAEIARRAPDAAVLIDEAYFEYYGKTMLGSWRRGLPNLFVARTFSKAFGMAGLRVGVLAGNAEHVDQIRRVTTPFNVNAVALACLPAALADAGYVREYVEQVRRGREQVRRELARWNVSCCPSEAAFLLANIGPSHEAFVRKMDARGVLVHDRSLDYGCEGWVRISIGKTEHTARLIEALGEVLPEIGATCWRDEEISRLVAPPN
ncbi:MAG TPA: aminotransferase class I/II-fold pyridoxal phosphate-dependent enzyme [Terriglobales bacterium]|nr:aminotransferase class I/II-fold pyridoxal phosphate-dependent enzyme [Terriglobales bacterium]